MKGLNEINLFDTSPHLIKGRGLNAAPTVYQTDHGYHPMLDCHDVWPTYHVLLLFSAAGYQAGVCMGTLDEIRREGIGKVTKICLVSASGGHFEELCRLKPLLEKYEGFVVTEKTDIECNADYFVTQTGIGEKGLLKDTVKLFEEVRKICKKEKPDFVITTGTFISLPFMVYCKLHRKKMIYIETFARVTDTDKAGRLMYKFADLFIYQWKELEEFYPKGVYGGSIF